MGSHPHHADSTCSCSGKQVTKNPSFLRELWRPLGTHLRPYPEPRSLRSAVLCWEAKQIMNPLKACSRTPNQCPGTKREHMEIQQKRHLAGALVTTVLLSQQRGSVKNRRRTSAERNPARPWHRLPWSHVRTSGGTHPALVKRLWAPLSSPRKWPTSVTSPVNQMVGVLVSLGCYYKYHRQGGLNNRNLFSPSPGGWNPRSRCGQGCFPLRPLFLVCRRPSSPCVLMWSSLCFCLCPNLLFL